MTFDSVCINGSLWLESVSGEEAQVEKKQYFYQKLFLSVIEWL